MNNKIADKIGDANIGYECWETLPKFIDDRFTVIAADDSIHYANEFTVRIAARLLTGGTFEEVEDV
jgi:hypothetical protein